MGIIIIACEHYDSLCSTIHPHAQPLQVILLVLEDKAHL